ncbi:MAG: sigma-70 family RNA polymerase sigma factor [Dysgonamonadaceae bacterium]|jgi:RNA polymerase sigma-70 factor (ECF subfamily)|nr:sigma-70 family RNA polymerase sigma factor [Dysgonamonadaceae bacterium]
MTQQQIQELIDRSKQGDTKAFEILMLTYQPLVFRLAFRLLCDDNRAKDIVQDVFVKIWLQIGKYKSHYRFSTWIYKITCNLCYDKLRSMKHFPEATHPPDTITELEIISQEDVEASVINNELKELILYFTGKLSPKQKLIFTLKEIEELDVEEIVDITGFSENKIKSNLYLARKNIKDKINAITS